ncbi:MAG TPA: DciA family protein [Noviherbaspirillum sp.]|uniref:DciA family protein n=1 Tax=Noviherbaspirillum sp. TaxID=1926288 RepID=UPI002B47E779|nr:DciA family protein [Noviherbaspirillum sp.]HJV88060.1 DciA family protein [Noviherbaspirillum sp.]
MVRSPSFISSKQDFKSTRASAKNRSTVTGVTDFLRAHDKMAVLLPAVTRINALQKECATILPALFEMCSVIQFEAGHLVLATPNAALATKLKQQLPKLQDGLLKRGWQVNAIRIKVQVSNIAEKKTPQKQLTLPGKAMSALASLHESLGDTPHNKALKAAISTMLERHRNEKKK